MVEMGEPGTKATRIWSKFKLFPLHKSGCTNVIAAPWKSVEALNLKLFCGKPLGQILEYGG